MEFGRANRLLHSGQTPTLVSLILALSLLVPSARGVLPNDTCDTAQLLTVGVTTPGTTIGLQSDSVPLCMGISGTSGVWYRVVGDGSTYTARINCGSGNPRISVYCSVCSALSCVTSNLTACGSSGATRTTWCTRPGQEYLIYAFTGTQGTFSITIESDATPCANPAACSTPPNDNCESAVTIAPGGVSRSTTGDAAVQSADSCEGAGPPGPGLWYRLVGTGAKVRASVACEEGSHAVSIFCAGCDDRLCVGSTEFGCNNAVEWCTGAGEEYLILVHSPVEQTGFFVLTIETVEPLCSNPQAFCHAPNDTCAQAQLAPIGSTVFGDPTSASPGLWYKVTGNGRTLTASMTCMAQARNDVQVFCGGCGPLYPVTGRTSTCSAGGTLQVNWCSKSGEEYYLFVRRTNTGDAPFSLVVQQSGTCSSPPVCSGLDNDTCASAKLISIGNFTRSTTIRMGLDSPATCPGVTGGRPGVWFKVVGDGSQLRARLTCESGAHSIGVFCAGCTYQSCVSAQGSGCSTTGASWCSEPGVEYLILVYSPSTGIFNLIVEQESATCTSAAPDCSHPLNDSCADAPVLEPGVPQTQDTFDAFGDAVASCDGGSIGSYGVWYKVAGTGNELSVSLDCESPESHGAYVFCGECPGYYDDTRHYNYCVANGPDACTNAAPMTWCSDPYTEYLVYVYPKNPATDSPFTVLLEESGVPCDDPPACTFPANDSCLGAPVMQPGEMVEASTQGAYSGGDAACTPRWNESDVWYETIGDGTTFTAHVCSDPAEDNPHVLDVFCNNCSLPLCVGSTSVDGSCEEASVSWCTQQGARYYLKVDGAYWTTKGDFELDLSSDHTPCGEPVGCLGRNDQCEDAIPIPIGQTVRDATFGSSEDETPYCGGYGFSRGLWYRVEGDGTILEAFLDSSFLSEALYGGLIQVYCDRCDDMVCVGGGPDYSYGYEPAARWCSRTGESYLVHVAYCNPDDGDYFFDLRIESSGIACGNASDCVSHAPPANDDCANATAIEGEGEFEFDSTHATPLHNTYGNCEPPGPYQFNDSDVWFEWTSTCDGPVTMETCGLTLVDTFLGVGEKGSECLCEFGWCGQFWNEDACGTQSRVTFQTTPGQVYLIQLQVEFPQKGGPGKLHIACEPERPIVIEACDNWWDYPSCPRPTLENALNSTRGEFVVADDLAQIPAISRVCWWGVYFDGEQNCERLDPDDFSITYYVDDCGQPGEIFAGPFRQSDGTLNLPTYDETSNSSSSGTWRTYRTIAGEAREFHYSAGHAEVVFDADTSYWIEISNSMGQECSWYWEAGSGHDGFLYQISEGQEPPNAYQRSDEVRGNMATRFGSCGAPSRASHFEGCLPGPDNDHCGSAISLAINSAVPFDTAYATTDGLAVTPSVGENNELRNYFDFGDRQVHKDVWFAHQAQCDAGLTVDLCDSQFNTKVAVYDSGCSNSVPIAINDDACGDEHAVQSRLSVNVRAGADYLIRVGGYRGDFGLGEMTLTYSALNQTDLRAFASYSNCLGQSGAELGCCVGTDFDGDGVARLEDYAGFFDSLSDP